MLEPRVLLSATPVGAEFRVNTYTTNSQASEIGRAVAMDANGNFVVTWSSVQNGAGAGYEVFAQRYNAQGVAQGSEFRVNTTGVTVNDGKAKAAVAMDDDGDFVIAWSSYQQDGSGNGIYAQRFDAAGEKQGGEFLVNTFTTSDQSEASVAMDADGDFVITWSSRRQDTPVPSGSDYGIYAQRYNAAGVAQGSEFRVHTTTTGQQMASDVAMDDVGNFVVTWNSDSQDGDGNGIYAQRFNAAGVAQGTEFLVNNHTTGPQRFPSIATDAAGNFVIVWESKYQDDGSYGVYAQRYDAAGNTQGGEFLVNTTTLGNQRYPDVARNAMGEFVISWQALNNTSADTSLFGVWAQTYAADGMATGTEFLVNTYTTNDQSRASVALSATGDFVIVWRSNLQDGDSNGVYAQLFTDSLPPTVSDQTFSVAENRPAGFVVGTVPASDPDAGQTLTYAITAGNTGNVFAINATTGQITVASPTLNFEALSQFVLTVQVTDDGSLPLSDTAVVTVNITDLNEAPVFLAPTTFTVVDSRPVGTVVGDVNAVDPENQSLAYSIIGGDPLGQFAIDGTTGVITIAQLLDAEVTSQYVLQVKALDNGSPANSRTQNVTVNVVANDPPVFSGPTTFAFSENRPVGYFVADLNATDPEMQTITYSLVGGDPNGQFAIDASTGVLTVAKATLDFETTSQFTLQVQALDGGNPAASTTQSITVNITNLNESPVFLAPTMFTIAENRPVGYFVGDVNTTDPEGQPVTYAIVGGDGKGQFAINPTTGVITVKKATIDYEANTKYLLQVMASDNGIPANSRTQTITVNVTNLNEAPVFVGAPTFNYAENQAVGSFVGDVNAVDPESNALTYGIVGGNPNDLFAIDTTTGVITLAKGSINYEATTQFVLQVRVQDNGNPSQNRTQAYTINITDVNETPIFVPPTSFTMLENRSVGYVVGTVSAVDPENKPLTYSIVGGNTNGQFAINASTGVITVAKATIDFETTPQFTLQIKAQDPGTPSLSATQAITVNVTNINEAPVFLAPTTFTIAENTGNGVVVGKLKTVDPEGNAVTYSLVGGNTGNAFSVNPTAGELIVLNSAALDFETTPQFLLSVKATDNGNPSNSRTQTITVNLINIAGARVPAPTKSPSITRPATGFTGQQAPSGNAETAGPAWSTSASSAQDSELYSFRLYEPWTTEPAAASDLVSFPIGKERRDR